MTDKVKWKIRGNDGHEYFVDAHNVEIQDSWFSFYCGNDAENWQIIATFHAPVAVLLASELVSANAEART